MTSQITVNAISAAMNFHWPARAGICSLIRLSTPTGATRCTPRPSDDA
jgi:hypothetical protein